MSKLHNAIFIFSFFSVTDFIRMYWPNRIRIQIRYAGYNAKKNVLYKNLYFPINNT